MDTKRGMDMSGNRTSAQDVQEPTSASGSPETVNAANNGPRYQEYDQPGLEVVEHSNLEVASPQQQHMNHPGAWEKPTPPPVPRQYSHMNYGSPNFHSPGEYATPHTTYSEHAFHPAYGMQPKEGEGFERTICGLRRQLFWILMAIGIFVVVAAIAVGVGLGIALHKNDTRFVISVLFIFTVDLERSRLAWLAGFHQRPLVSPSTVWLLTTR
jgi:hypothetical protein